MKHAVVLITKPGPERLTRNSILERGDMEIIRATDLEAGFQAIVRGPCDLFILDEGWEEPVVAHFMELLRAGVRISGLKGILVARTIPGSAQGSPSLQALPPPVTAEALNAAVARALNIPARTNRRYLVRMCLGMRDDTADILATLVTVNIDEGGMLVESAKPLSAGRFFQWAFSGARELDGLVIAGKVLREVPNPRNTSLHHYAVQFDPAARDKRQVLGRFLSCQA
jgi:hypothetical protein